MGRVIGLVYEVPKPKKGGKGKPDKPEEAKTPPADDEQADE